MKNNGGFESPRLFFNDVVLGLSARELRLELLHDADHLLVRLAVVAAISASDAVDDERFFLKGHLLRGQIHSNSTWAGVDDERLLLLRTERLVAIA